MPKPLPSNNMPWPQNLIYDFSLPEETSPEEAESFISSIETSDRNKAFLRLRYLEGKQYKEISGAFGITPSAVRMAMKYLREKYVAASVTAFQDDASATDNVEEAVPPLPATEKPVAPSEPTDVTENKPDIEEPARPELKPIITAIATTTRQRSFAYDSKTRVVISSDQIPRGLRKDSRYISLPDYYQIKEYDLMQEFAAAISTSSPDKGSILEAALGGVGPFKAFRSKVREIGLGQAWADYRYQKFADLAEEWWEREVAATTLPGFISNDSSNMDTRGEATGSPAADHHTSPTVIDQPETGGVLIVDPAALNGIGLIETIRVLYRRVGPANFEEALDELRDAMCSFSTLNSDQRGNI